MIFSPPLVAMILTGDKTQTRVRLGRREMQAGRSYAVQSGRGKQQTCRIVVTATRQEMLHDITDQDAQLEGFPDREAFFGYWRELHGDGPLIEIPVRVITFELDRGHVPRLLTWADRPRHSELGYTDFAGAAMTGEPEAVDEVVASAMAKANQVRHDRHQTESYLTREKLSLERRLALARREAKESGMDASRILNRIDRQIRDLERKLAQKRAA